MAMCVMCKKKLFSSTNLLTLSVVDNVVLANQF